MLPSPTLPALPSDATAAQQMQHMILGELLGLLRENRQHLRLSLRSKDEKVRGTAWEQLFDTITKLSSQSIQVGAGDGSGAVTQIYVGGIPRPDRQPAIDVTTKPADNG